MSSRSPAAGRRNREGVEGVSVQQQKETSKEVHEFARAPNSMDAEAMASIEVIENRPLEGNAAEDVPGVTQPWLSTKVAQQRRRRRLCHNPFHVRDNRKGSVERDQSYNPYDHNRHYIKRNKQPFCSTKDVNISRSPSEFCRKNGLDKPYNVLQILSWVFFGLDVLLGMVFLIPSLSLPVA
eukprot:Gregarina_sp_Poly_1__8087@NODE_465_length_8170_cov_101_841787_g379_i0_p4_GENE_NODE_465_length_8170_cov_101_841787_g379_i0NODE_465_length_8170_cov_101_841787_g379_i0_p4_ORF_typecomplete_len181_score16_17_NODE_465_length_8170_cov_101_841787_g379_i047815323